MNRPQERRFAPRIPELIDRHLFFLISGNNFSLFYSYAQARLKLPKKSQNILVGAANVLVADTNSSHSPDMDGSDDEAMSGSENNNLGGGDVNLSIGKR